MEGERILIPERMIVSPADGVFRYVDEAANPVGTTINVDDVIGYVETVGQSIEITSPFHGVIHGMIAHNGERLRRHEPVAWLRVVTG